MVICLEAKIPKLSDKQNSLSVLQTEYLTLISLTSQQGINRYVEMKTCIPGSSRKPSALITEY